MSDRADAPDVPGRERPVPITLNKKPVKVDGPTATGLQIKQAAIEQGVSIQIDFKLSVIGDDGKEVPVRDDQHVQLHHGSEFFAVAGDDNS
ncbi:multiubiquitin domain-containing protein [Candidatus Poriferisodalis sp.]|uniref:multiubiquitin domain-containing protein n=1 Tax=Candidatus Poriferisodalis sp. TaxID=3101277 RepID=UPI003B02927C